jgi:hypothetical protein
MSEDLPESIDLDAILGILDRPVVPAPGDTVFHSMANLFSVVEFTDKRVERMVVGTAFFERLLTEPDFLSGSDLTASQSEKDDTGYHGTFWNAGLYVNGSIPDGHLVLLPEGDTTVITRSWSPSSDQLSPLISS